MIPRHLIYEMDECEKRLTTKKLELLKPLEKRFYTLSNRLQKIAIIEEKEALKKAISSLKGEIPESITIENTFFKKVEMMKKEMEVLQLQISILRKELEKSTIDYPSIYYQENKKTFTFKAKDIMSFCFDEEVNGNSSALYHINDFEWYYAFEVGTFTKNTDVRPTYTFMGVGSGLQVTGSRIVTGSTIVKKAKCSLKKTPLTEFLNGNEDLNKDQLACIVAGKRFFFKDVEIPCDNSEIRRLLIDRYPRCLLQFAIEVGSELDNQGNEIVLYGLNGLNFLNESYETDFHKVTVSPNKVKMVRVVCPSTGRIYYHLVPFEIKSPREAVAWMFSLTLDDYGRLQKET